MPDKPLLIFPIPSPTVRKKKDRKFPPSSYHFPDFSRQKDRLTPQFNSMLQSFIVDIADGLEPEQVLVIETVGQIDDFQRAVNAIDGLEWLAEIDDESVKPDDDFFNQSCRIGKSLFSKKIESINRKQSSQIWHLLLENNFINTDGYLTDKDFDIFKQFITTEFSEHSEEIIKIIKSESIESRKKDLSGRLFLSMSNKQAIDKLLSLWNQWDSGDKKLPQNYGKWAEIFKQTKTLRRWDTQDRLRDTGIIDYWKEELELKKGTSSKIIFEIELWYRNNKNQRNDVQNKISDLISNENGSVIKTCTINEIRFHAIKAELPPEGIEKVLNSEYTKVFICNDVMFFRPVGQCRVDVSYDGLEMDFKSGNTAGEPVVAIFDGAPFAHHRLLENRLIIDDPDDFESDYPTMARKHGTAMASLVCHGELDAHEEPLSRPVYFRPIMKPDLNDFANNPPRENIPKEYFMEDLIERSVRRIFEGDGNEDAVAPTIKVINISIADSTKMFFNTLSSCAKLLDWLSFKYQVLFCVSAGNINDINLQKDINELRSLSSEDLIRHTVLKILEDIRNRKIFSPADSINSISLGSIHADSSTINNIGNRFDILPNLSLPSPISAHGFGYKNSIKPELYLFGGRQLYDTTNNVCRVSDSGLAPGQCVATSPVAGGEINRCVYTRGTSNSAALATRAVAQIYEMLNTLLIENGLSIDESNIAVILKTLLVHGASWSEGHNVLESILITSENPRNFKKIIARYMGFGIPNIRRVLECTSQRATAIGYGKIKKDDKHDFKFPLPPCLSGRHEKRRLTITLAWFSPVNPANRKYRKANLSFEPHKDIIGVDRINADGKQVKNGTVQHEVLEGSKVVSYQDGDYLEISVVCREHAQTLDEEVYYGLAVTLETGESVALPIYEEIKDRIRIPIEVGDKIL
ncbi:MAG TPA: S8 family peptidase [Thermodesulfovibrionia bacterium]|nr:S8 family peptidase [Thermodesulfovibrionia bacterium]